MKYRIGFFIGILSMVCLSLFSCKESKTKSDQQTTNPGIKKSEVINEAEKAFAEATSAYAAGEKVLVEERFPKEIADQFLLFKQWVKKDDTLAIARLIPYPLKRPNALIQNEAEFVTYYKNIFDDSLKKKIADIQLEEKDFIIKSDNYGILGGKMWFSRHSGKITSLRYLSDSETQTAILKEKSIKGRDHESIQGWDQAIVRCETENYTIYILQYPDYDLRYVSWNKSKTSSDKPDLLLSGGKTEHKGTMGGSTYRFHNGTWTYAIDERRMGPDETNGFFLQVFKNDELVKEEKAVRLIE